MTRAASLLLRVLGLALVLVGLMGFVLVGADGTWTARADIPAGRSAVLLEPAVVSVLGPSVTVRVEPTVTSDAAGASGVSGLSGLPGADSGLFIGRGRSDDLTIYARDLDVARVVGLARSRVLDVRAAAGSGASRPLLRRPNAVDLWQQQVSGPDAHALSWRPTRGAQSVLVAHQDGTPLPALDVEVTWTDRTWLWMPIAALLLGLGLLAAGLVVGGAFPAPRPAPALPPTLLEGARRRRTSASRRPEPTADPAPPVPPAPPEPAPEPALTHPAPPAVAPAEAVPPVSRRAARGRRRKRTLWDRAVSRARSAAPAVTGAGRPDRPNAPTSVPTTMPTAMPSREAEHSDGPGDRS
jgi:hypothetical protein